jgi:hypothetical protein
LAGCVLGTCQFQLQFEIAVNGVGVVVGSEDAEYDLIVLERIAGIIG